VLRQTLIHGDAARAGFAKTNRRQNRVRKRLAFKTNPRARSARSPANSAKTNDDEGHIHESGIGPRA